jgi:hypothetical protein
MGAYIPSGKQPSGSAPAFMSNRNVDIVSTLEKMLNAFAAHASKMRPWLSSRHIKALE